MEKVHLYQDIINILNQDPTKDIDKHKINAFIHFDVKFFFLTIRTGLRSYPDFIIIPRFLFSYQQKKLKFWYLLHAKMLESNYVSVCGS